MVTTMNNFLNMNQLPIDINEALKTFLQGDNTCLQERRIYLSNMLKTFKNTYLTEDNNQSSSTMDHNYI